MDSDAIDVPANPNNRLAIDPLESRIRSHLAAWLESAGVDRAFVVKAFSRVDGALDAESVRRVFRDGAVTEFRDPDHVTRLKAVDRALDLASRAGVIPSSVSARGSGSTSPQINVSIVLLSGGGEERTMTIQPTTEGQGR